GKIKISDPFEPHLQRFERALHLAERFQVKNIRVFSYYPSEEGKPWADVRAEVLRRMEIKVARAEKRGLRLVHENEARIYGEDPIRVLDLLRSLASPAFQAAYDAGNYVHGGYDPIQAWNMTREYTVHLHIKDWMPGGEKGVLPGTGAGRIPESIALAKEQNYSGFATLEPHLLGGGPTGGITGPELFPQAIAAFRAILDQAGYEHS
ncbi:MAG TPA: sugar phosphate isomerase/epimerase, partial [Gemmatales bacterium]|nr:sugar phosphate isomerase/epimerase [Gemmatales bacterium]